MRSIKVLMLPKYGLKGASSRMRSWQYLHWLKDAIFEVTLRPLITDDLLNLRYQSGGYGNLAILNTYVRRLRILMANRAPHVLWIEKESLPWFPLWVELALLRGRPYVLDYDDAIFHNYDLHPNVWVRRIYGKRLDGLMARAALVTCGNQYLAQRARDAGAPWVEVVPTVIDLDRYSTKQMGSDGLYPVGGAPRIVWIGSPSTAKYLDLLVKPLQALALRCAFVLRVIGGGQIDIPGVQVEVVPWSEATEVEQINTCDVGVMPLLDSPWERGKCGYKLIQYMACGLPVVASPVGVNSEIVRHGENGFLAETAQDWEVALEKLLNDHVQRTQMGLLGRQIVEQRYCIQQTGPRLAELLRVAASK